MYIRDWTQKVKFMSKMSVISIGNSIGVILSKEIAARLRIEKGDTLFAIETPNGIELTPYDPSFALEMKLAKEIMQEDRSILRKLAKGVEDMEEKKTKVSRSANKKMTSLATNSRLTKRGPLLRKTSKPAPKKHG